MQKNLADHQRKLVAIIDPHIKQDANYYVQTEGAKRGCFVKDKTGDKDFDGCVMSCCTGRHRTAVACLRQGQMLLHCQHVSDACSSASGPDSTLLTAPQHIGTCSCL